MSNAQTACPSNRLNINKKQKSMSTVLAATLIDCHIWRLSRYFTLYTADGTLLHNCTMCQTWKATAETKWIDSRANAQLSGSTFSSNQLSWSIEQCALNFLTLCLQFCKRISSSTSVHYRWLWHRAIRIEYGRRAYAHTMSIQLNSFSIIAV